MAYSLIAEPWLPVIRRHSGACWIRPAEIVDQIETDPVMTIAWPRADFRLAALEFLIGLLAVACPPADRQEWRQQNKAPPSRKALAAAFAPLSAVFHLDGDGPRFMQDFHPLRAESNEIAILLIDAPGERTLEKNTDLLNKRGRVQKLSRAAAAMALYTLQTYAPAGGKGNRTGLRGGGPLTTLALPPGEPNLWQALWANVPYGKPVPRAEWPRIFPWLAPTITSENGRTIAPAHAGIDPLVFWGTPRRIRLEFTAAAKGASCDLTGQSDGVMVTGWQQRPYGANYDSAAFLHPLSPRYRPKPKEPVSLPVHPQPGGIGYKDFLGLLFQAPDGTAIPAPCISTYVNDRRPARHEIWRILAAGYNMDQMKARGFVEAELPVFGGTEGPEQFAILAQLILGAEQTETLLRFAVRTALFTEMMPLDTGNAGFFASLRAQFWQESEPDFYAAAGRVAAQAGESQVTRGFLAALTGLVLRLFDAAAPITASDHPARIAAAARLLNAALHGYGKAGTALFTTMNLPLPPAAKKRKTA